MSKDYKAITKDISQYVGELKKLAPGAMEGFYAMSGAATANGRWTRKPRS